MPRPWVLSKRPCTSLCPNCKGATCEDKDGNGHSGVHHHGTHFWT